MALAQCADHSRIAHMKNLKQLRIGQQVLTMFGVLVAILGLIGAFLFFSLRSIQQNTREQLSYVVNEGQLGAAAGENIGPMQALIFRHILASSPHEQRLHEKAIQKIDQANAEGIATYQKYVDTQKEGQLYARILQTRKEYLELTEKLLELSRENRDAAANAFAISKQIPAYDPYQTAITEMTTYVEEEVRDIAGMMDYRVARIRTTANLFIIVTILIAVAMGFEIGRASCRAR